MQQVRPTAVAGAFYPDDPETILSAFSHWMPEKMHTENTSSIPRALIVPHAGYIYSGEAAAKGYQLWRDADEQIKTIVVMGPAHRVPFDGIATISVDEVETPLGNLAVDTKLRNELLSECSPVVGVSDIANAPEHSLEVHFPFIKSLLPNVKVLPLLNGQVSAHEVMAVMDRLWREEGVYFVISSDLSHFHTYEEAQSIDAETAIAIRQGNWQVLNGEMACGYKGIQGLLGLMPEHPMMIEELGVINSGDTAGTKDRVVGYGTWAVYELR